MKEKIKNMWNGILDVFAESQLIKLLFFWEMFWCTSRVNNLYRLSVTASQKLQQLPHDKNAIPFVENRIVEKF